MIPAMFALAVMAAATTQAKDQLAEALVAVCAVDSNGAGNESAVKAMRLINQASIDQVPAILEAMDSANSISLNWLRGSVNSIVGRGGELPREAIKEYFADTSHSAMGRLLAFDLLTQGRDELATQLIPTLIDDPSMPLRRKAVAALIEKSESVVESDPVAAIGNLGYALNKARDIAQVQLISKKLDSLGVKVNLQQQLGFINTWNLVGSFDNKDMSGFDVAHGPEEAIGMIDLSATYKDMEGNETTWKQVTTDHETGNVDLNDYIGKVKGATVYALGTFKAAEARDAEFRIGTANATKIWLNGNLVMSNEIYHNSNSIDKFSGKVELQKGDNEILIKVCQNEQTEPWAQDWQFQFRICDETGKAIPEAVAPQQQY
jgi:hypothetical protein